MSVDQLAVPPADAARRLLGSVLWSGPVGVRIVEVEAYGGDPAGPWPDSASHSGRGPTTRNAVMFGPAGVLYVYLSYGTHFCVNVTSGPDGVASAVLLRSGEVVAGLDTARARRPTARRDHDLARGPGNFGRAMGITLADYGTDLLDRSAPVRLALHEPIAPERIASGPRVGVSLAAEVTWRFWLPESAAVSAYRRSPRAPRPAT
ncbi:DNA-3-methyladenine glycosylase [Nocardia noduli]|uniref:DNA-3-methyladenine glycosylase n=1 Tax=Nocardia noduli TaxID=2815722 RepID=UPI001C2213D4|nr:DNA-3-methyladenine glycosylase [Nocardia noduli]